MRPGAARQNSLREHNLALVLRHIAAAGTGRAEPGRAPSRADVAAATGLTRATVSTLVDELVAGGLVAERDPLPRNGAGRPATGLVLHSGRAAGLGLEINVDYLAACVRDLTGAVRHRVVDPGDQRRDPDEVFAALGTLAGTAREAAAAEGLTIAGAALAVPGLVQAEGLVRLAPNLGWRDVDATAALAGRPELAGLAPTVDNEANLAALGELQYGELSSFVYVSSEIGIGAGIVLNGRLFRGARGWSGELGHVTVDPDGPPCRCGASGCLEQYAGEEAIRRAAELHGHAAALESAGRALGVAVAGMVNLLDVDTVVLGGPHASTLFEPVGREVAQRTIRSGWSPVEVRLSVLGSDAAVMGAAGSVIQSVLDHPAHWLAS